MTRPAHRPPNPHTAAGLALVAAGLTPEEAAEQLREQGCQISGKTIRRAMASGAAPPRPGTARGDQPPRRLSSASGTIPTHATGAGKPFLHRGGDQKSQAKSRRYSDGGQTTQGNIPGNIPEDYRGDAMGATAPRLSPGARRSSRVNDGGSAWPTGDEGGDPTHGPTGGDPRASGLGPSLPPAKLSNLRELIGRLPFAQQDHLVATLPLERLRREAIARGIAPYHEASAAVARELRAVRL